MTKLAYMGRYVNTDKKVVHELAHVEPHGDDGKVFKTSQPRISFAPKRASALKGAIPGLVYEIEIEDRDDKTLITWPKDWFRVQSGRLNDHERSQAQASDATAENAAKAMKASRTPDLDDAISVLARARPRNTMQAAAFDVWVMARLRRGS